MRSYFNKLWRFGFLNALLCFLTRFKLSILRLYFGFSAWHVHSNYRCRPYKQKVIDALGNIESSGVVDVGCGLGEIGFLLKKNNSAIKYYGIDRKANVIAAAKYLSRNDNFRIGSFESISTIDGELYNTLLLLNFTASLEPGALVDLIMSNVTSNIRYILVDVIRVDAGWDYQVKHSAPELISLGLSFKLIGRNKNLDKYRDLLIFERVC